MECQLDSITVHYETRGFGRPILMLHGFGPDHRLMFGSMEPAFARRSGWQRIYIDLPGIGLTKGEEWIRGSDEMLTVVEQFIDAVLPGQRFVLAGESYGGYLSRGLVARRPDQIDGLLLIAPVIHPAVADRTLPPRTVLVQGESLLARLTPEQVEAFTEMAVVQDHYNWERFDVEVRAGVQIADQPFLARIKERYAFTFGLEPFSRPYEAPVLILAGRQDHVTGYKDQFELLEHYPRGTFAVLDRAGHNLQIEQSRAFTALVSEWLDRIEAVAD